MLFMGHAQMRRKHQISNWVPLDLMTIHLKGYLTDWVKLYPLDQHASDSEEEEGTSHDLPNKWPVRVCGNLYGRELILSPACCSAALSNHTR